MTPGMMPRFSEMLSMSVPGQSPQQQMPMMGMQPQQQQAPFNQQSAGRFDVPGQMEPPNQHGQINQQLPWHAMFSPRERFMDNQRLSSESLYGQ